jgi:hypothetical protein
VQPHTIGKRGARFDTELNLAAVVRDWHDFYGLVGTASATLVELMFIAASIGARVFGASEQEPMQAYLTPTVAHFSSLLFMCILVLIPSQTWTSLSIGLGRLGVAGVAYSIRQWIGVFWTLHSRIDLARSLVLYLHSAPRLFAGRRFSRYAVRAAAVECRIDSCRGSRSATG